MIDLKNMSRDEKAKRRSRAYDNRTEAARERTGQVKLALTDWEVELLHISIAIARERFGENAKTVARKDIAETFKRQQKELDVISAKLRNGYDQDMPALDGHRRKVFVDGADKGEVYRQGGRWFWERGSSKSVEAFKRGATLADVADWARKCCNGQMAQVKVIK